MAYETRKQTENFQHVWGAWNTRITIEGLQDEKTGSWQPCAVLTTEWIDDVDGPPKEMVRVDLLSMNTAKRPGPKEFLRYLFKELEIIGKELMDPYMGQKLHRPLCRGTKVLDHAA